MGLAATRASDGGGGTPSAWTNAKITALMTAVAAITAAVTLVNNNVTSARDVLRGELDVYCWGYYHPGSTTACYPPNLEPSWGAVGGNGSSQFWHYWPSPPTDTFQYAGKVSGGGSTLSPYNKCRGSAGSAGVYTWKKVVDLTAADTVCSIEHVRMSSTYDGGFRVW